MKINYKKFNQIGKYRFIANFIIVAILITLVAITTTSNYSYVFNYENENVIYNGNKNSDKVSLMINVYWGDEYLDGILEVLSEYNIKTTFFVGGSWVKKDEKYMKKIIEHGHEIGNHGYFHKDQDKLNYDQNHEEIQANHNLVKVLYGINMTLFAPPSGAYNKSTIEAAQTLGYTTIMWSKDTIDWRDHDANLILKRATNNVKGGDLILMHPTAETLKALPSILEYYKMNNLKATTVSDCLK